MNQNPGGDGDGGGGDLGEEDWDLRGFSGVLLLDRFGNH